MGDQLKQLRRLLKIMMKEPLHIKKAIQPIEYQMPYSSEVYCEDKEDSEFSSEATNTSMLVPSAPDAMEISGHLRKMSLRNSLQPSLATLTSQNTLEQVYMEEAQQVKRPSIRRKNSIRST